MRRYFGIIITAILVIAVLVALGAVGSVEFDRPTETEASPNRSSYNAGPTGTRAFYQLLEESGIPVARWRDDYKSLDKNARNATLILIGPYQFNNWATEAETRQLRNWIHAGGQLLVVSRSPKGQFGDSVIHSEYKENISGWNVPAEQADKFVDHDSDDLIVQPTELTHNLHGLALSGFASRLKFYVDTAESSSPSEESQTPPPTHQEGNSEAKPGATSSPSPAVSPTITPDTSIEVSPEKGESPQGKDADEIYEPIYAPLIHLGEKNGAILADFKYGEGRIIFLSDPFVIANNGIGRGSNLTLAMNLVRSLGEGGRKFLFDEFHHGFRDESNPLFNYFRGTPMPWLMMQAGLIAALLIYTFGRRFARPLPLPRTDRHSPLEFVGSMANLQQAAEARDLALENIYPRFKAKLCQRLSLSSRATVEEIVAAAHKRSLPISDEELRKELKISENVLSGGKAADGFDDAALIKAVATFRRIMAYLEGR